jgi:hypothetical protein
MPYPPVASRSNIAASRLMDFDLIASEYARHRKILLPVFDGLRDFVAGIGRKGGSAGARQRHRQLYYCARQSTGCARGASIAPRAC